LTDWYEQPLPIQHGQDKRGHRRGAGGGTLMFARSLQNYWSKKGKLSLRQYDVLKSMYDELKGNQ
jgi:hypothetical protein